MPDEISQVVEMECRGVYYLLKGSKEFIALMAKALRALTIKYHTHYLNKPGNCDWKDAGDFQWNASNFRVSKRNV